MTRRSGCESATIVLLLVLSLDSCGGRVARPVSATTPYDSQLTCEHITAERTVNDARIADLKGEEHDDIDNDVGFAIGMGLTGAIFLDTSDAEKSEIKALHARNAVLDDLMAKKCPNSTPAS